MAFTDALAVLALAYFAGNALVHVVYALSTLTFVMFAKFIGMRDVEALLYPRLPAMLLPIVRGIVSFSATILWAASAVFLRVLPFLVLCLLLSVLHANAEELLKMFLDVYNNNISHDPLMRYLRHALLGAKLAGHYLLPLYNFVITVFASGTYKLFTLFLDDTNQVLSTSTLNALFQLLGGTYSVLADWVVHNVGECAMSVALIENITATPAHRCVQLGPDAFRALDAARLVGPVQTLATEGAKVLLVTCPAVHRLALVALYPVIEATHLVDALENMLNALLAVVYGMWDVTRLRCAAARATRETADWLPRARTSMCVPDVAPVFLFGSAGLRALGRLFDNWAGMVFKEILALFFMADAPAGGGGGGACQSASERLSSADVQALVQRLDHPQDARLVPVSSALVAASDGRTALFKQLDSEHVARAAFPTPVALRAGFAPVVFVQSAEFADPDGSMQTALLGCRCAAPAHGTGVTLSCSFALYTSGAATQARDVQLHFENEETSAAFASCDELSIRVQPLRFTPRAISDTARRAAFYEAGGLASEVECVRNPAACASADAAIYVTPICRGDTTVCLRGLQNSRCFPYCVGLHQRGAGSAPITLYHYETLDRGVFMTNTDCCASPLLAAAGGAGVPAQTTITDASDPAATTQLSCTLSAIAAFDTREQHACVVTGGSSTADAPPMLPVVDQPNLPRPHVAEFQPVLFAGDSALVPRCRVYIPEQSPEGALEWDCDWGVDVQRLATSLGNEYHVQAVRTDVPGARVGAGAGPPEVTAGTLPLPGAPAQSLAGPLPAALFADGLAYAINPNFDRVKSLIAHKPIFSVAVGELESAAVFVARPRTMCTREQLVYQEHTSSPGDRVLLCAHNMTQRVEFADAHAFIQYSELGSNQPGERNLFVEAVDYYDARNLLVTVRRGRARALCAALGYAGCDADVQPAHTVFYFVHMQNLQVREGSPWVSPVLLHATNYQGLLGCKQDTFLPPLGALLGAVGDVGLTTMRVGVNSFLLNGIGQVDDMLSQTVVNTGTGSLLDAARFTPSSVRLCHNAFGHHAYEPCSERPLSTAPVLASMQRLFALVHVCARRVVLYLHILTGVAFGEGSWFQNVILTATTPDSGYAILGVDALANAGAVSVGTVFSVLASTVHFGFYFVDDVVLGGVRAVLRHLRTRPSLNISPSDLLMLFAGVLYNTLHDGTYDAKVTTAGGSVCLHLSGAFGDPTLPLGLFAWNACQAAFALHRAALRFAATALSMVGLSDCVCHNTERTRTGELSARCATRIPDAFRAEFDAFVRTSTRASVACERMLEHIEAELNAVPVVLFTHLENAFDALRGVPQQLAAYMHLPVFSELSCASYTSSADSAIMLPRPLSEFRRCAFTQTCAGRCSASFGGFHAAIARSEAEGVQPARPPAASTVQLPVQPWTTPDGWQPVALQHYGAQVVARCSEWMVVLAASARGSGPDGAARGASWHVFGYCFAQGTALQFTRELDVDVTMLVPPKLDVLPLQGAPAGARFALNQAWPTTLPHDGSLRARFLLVVSQVGYANGVLELTVPASGEARASWVFAARDTYALETCDAVTPAARAVLQESVGVSADAEVDFDVQREPHIRQALWFPRAAGAYTVVARVRAHALVGAARYPFELAMRLRVGADGATDCRAFPLLEAEPLHAGARSAHALFEGLLRNARLFANASDNDGHGGEGRLVLLERGEDGLTMREFFPLSDTQAHAEGEAGLLYFNESGDAVHDVQAEGRYAVLNTLPAQYDISARQDTFLNARLYSPVLVDTKLGAHDRGYHLLLSDTTKQTSFDNWFSVFALRHAGHQQLDLLSLSFSAPETVTVSKDCNYMQCEDCRTDELQALCFVAQRCALQRCVGTVINPTNVFCSVGILLRETAMYSGAEEGVLYSMVVEGLLAAVREWQGGSTGTSVIYVQSLSNVYTTIMCDIKNVLAALSALLPSFYATMYRLAQPRRSVQRTSTPPARGDARFEIAATLSPRELIESAGTYFALSQAAFQFLLGIIFNFMHDVEVVTCLVAKFSGVFEQYNVRVEFVHNSGQFLFEGGGSPCEMIFRDDISFSRGQQTTAQNEAFLMDLIRRGGLAVAARPRFQLSTFDLTDVQDAAGSILSATVGAARTFLMLRYSYFIKWVVGLVYGVGGVLMQMQADTCSPTVVIGPEVLGCACGDDPFHIPPERATNSLGWCRGVLELTTTDGLRVHVHNPYEYADLRAKMGLELAILLHEMQADAASDIAGTNAGDVLRDLYVVGLAEAAYNSALKPAYEAVRDFVPGAAQAAAEAIKGALTASAAADLEGPILQELGDPSTAVVSALRDLVASNLVRDAANTVLQSAIIGTDALVSATGIDELLESEQLRASVAAAIDAAVRAAEATATAVGNVAVDTAEVADAGLAAVGGAAEATATAGGIDALSAAHTVALLADPEVRAGTEALVQQVVVQAAAQLRDSEAVTALTEARIELRERLVEAAVGLSQRDATAATADDLLTAQLPLLKGALHGAPAASVFMQCRNNYARRRWDPGAFAAMSRDARDAELRAEYEALVGEHAASEAQRERALQCFRAGNTSNTVEACTQLVFADLAAHFEYTRADEAESFAGAAADAFVGEKTLPAADAAKLRAVATLPDACRLYSAPGLQSVEALRGCATDDHFTSQCERSEATYDTPCETNRVLQYHQGALSVALADSYVVHAARNETELREQAQSRYNKIRNCIRTRFDSVLDNTAALEAVVADLDIAVYSSEGDALHQMLDCTFLGATNSTDLLPNEPPPAAVERMRYAGPPPGEECEGTHVTDVHTSTRELVRTCGSPARVAIVTWFKRQLMANNGEKIRLLLMRRLNELSANITNLENYGCYDSATGNTGLEYCTQDAPWPAAVTDTTIRAEDILNLAAVRDGEEQPGSNFYVHALTNATAWTRYVTDEGKASLLAYAEQAARREELGLGYPVDGVLDGSAESFAFPLTRDRDRLSLATQCHAQLRARMLSTPLVDVHTEDNTSWVTLPLLRDMLAQGVEWRPLERAAASLHAHWPRAEFVRRLLAREASDNDLELLYDKRLVPGPSLFCRNASRTSHEKTRTQPHHVLNFAGRRALGDARAHCPCGTATLAETDAGEQCDMDARVCATVQALASAAPECLRVACNALTGSAAATLRYERGAESCLPGVREFLETHAELLRAKGFTCTSMTPSDLWGLDALELNQEREKYSDEAYVFLKNGVSAANAEHVTQQVGAVLDEGRRTAYMRSPADASGNTRVDNVLCAEERDELLARGRDALDHAVAENAFPAVSMVAEAPAVTACLNYIMQHTVYAMLEFAAEQQGVRDDADVRAVLQTVTSKRAAAHERCALQLHRLDTCVAQGAFDDGALREAARVRGSERAECPFVPAVPEPGESARVFVLDPPCVALLRDSAAAQEDRLFDLHACVAHGALHEGELLTSQLLRTPLARNCSFADPRGLLARGTGEAAADLPLLSAAYVRGVIAVEPDARTGGVLGVARGVDWLFPGVHPSGAHGYAPIPYWPRYWQPAAPGQQLVEPSEAEYAGAFDGYMALLEDEDDGGARRFVVLPHHLRNATLAARVFGAAGFCREPTYAMPMAETNTLRQCTSKRPETIAAAAGSSDTEYNLESGACSPSAAVSAGGGLGDTVGDLWPLFRPLLERAHGDKLQLRPENTNNDQLQELAHTLAQASYTHALALEGGASLEDVTAALCREDYSVHRHPTALTLEHGGCYKNAECPDAQMCSSALGVCVEVQVQVENADAHANEFALSSDSCDGQGPRGASPWEQVAGLLHAHGLCAHANTVAYEYMHELNRSGECEPVSGGRVHRCKASAEWHWVRQVPPQTPARAFPETPTDLYEAGGHSWRADRTGMFALEPDECDAEYMADSRELKMCRLKRVPGTEPEPSQSPWMRTSDWYSETFHVLHDLGISHQAEPPAEDALHEKLRFLGLHKGGYQHATAETPAVLNCRAIGLCGIETVRVAGKHQAQRLLEEGVPHKFEDNKDCGAMGVRHGARCKLDHRTTVLYRLVRDDDAACSLAHLHDQSQGTTNIGPDDSYNADSQSVDKVRAELNAVLFALPFKPQTPEDAAQVYEQVHKCAVRAQQRLLELRTPQIYDPGALANASGLYFFHEYAAHELPVLWWLKYQHYTLFYPEARAALAAASADASGRIAVPSFDARLSMGDLLTKIGVEQLYMETDGRFAQEPLTIRDAWARTPLRVDLTRQNVEDYIATFVGYNVNKHIKEKNLLEYNFACPRDLSFATYENTDARPQKFENIADGYWHQNDADLASMVLRVHDGDRDQERGIVREYETGALARILLPVSNTPGAFEFEAAASTATLVQDMVAQQFKAEDVQVLSPFDEDHRDELIHKFNTDGAAKYVPIARFKLPPAFALSDDTIRGAVSEYEEQRSNCNNKALQFEDMDGLAADDRLGTHCIFGTDTAARLRESTAMGKFVDGEPAVELVRDDDRRFKRYLCEHDGDVVPDYMHPSESSSKYPQCSFRKPDNVADTWPVAYEQMSQRFDVQEEEIEIPPAGEVPDGFCEYDEYGHLSYEGNSPQLYPDPDSRSVARAYMPNKAPNKPYTDRCFRLDSACVTQRDELREFFTGLDADGDVYDDVYERIEHNSFTQMNTNGAFYTEDKPSHFGNLGTWRAYQRAYDAWASTTEQDFMTENKKRNILTRRSDAFFVPKRRSRVYDVRWLGDNAPPSGIVKTVYKLDEYFDEASYAHLTSKDRVLFNVPRVRDGANSRDQLLFGHHKNVNDNGRTLAAPTFSFCPGDDPETDMHYFREVDTSGHRRVTAPAFGVRASMKYVENTRDSQKLFKVENRDTLDNIHDGFGFKTWNELRDLLFRRISFSQILPDESPVEQLICPSLNYFASETYDFFENQRELDFFLRADPRELPFDKGGGDHWMGKNLPCLESIFSPFYWPFEAPSTQVCFPSSKLGAVSASPTGLADSLATGTTEEEQAQRCEIARTAPLTMSSQKLFYDADVTDSQGLGHYKIAKEVYLNKLASENDKIDDRGDFWFHTTFNRPTKIESGPYQGQSAAHVNAEVIRKIETARTNQFNPSLGLNPAISGILSEYLWVPDQQAYAIERNSMLDVFNVFESDPTSDDAASNTRPCKMPRAGTNIALTDLATCYEQDVYEAPNRRPWWATTACDMLRGFLDGMSSYESLRHWLQFKLPSSLSLSFLSQFSMHDFLFLNDGKYISGDVEKFRSKYTSANLETFLTNHIVARDETLLLHHNLDDLYEVPSDQNLLHTLLGMHVKDKRTTLSEKERKLFLTPCLKTYRENSQNLHMIQSLDAGGYCKHGDGASRAFITKPTLWSEMDGRAGKHMVPCTYEERIDPDNGKECYRLIKNADPCVPNAQTGQPSAICKNRQVTSYRIKLGGAMRCRPSTPVSAGEDAHLMHLVPVWGLKADLETSTPHYQGVWEKVQCRSYNPAATVLRRRGAAPSGQPPAAPPCVGCGLYEFDYNAKKATPVRRVASNTSNPLQHSVREAYAALVKDTNNALEKLNDALKDMNKALSLRGADDGSGSYLLMLQLEDDADEMRAHAVNESIRHAFDAWGGEADQTCFASAADTENNPCWFPAYNSEAARVESAHFLIDIQRACVPLNDSQLDRRGMTGCLDEVAGNTSQLSRLEQELVDRHLRNADATTGGLALGVDVLAARASATFERETHHPAPSWKTGVHAFFARQFRGATGPFLRSVFADSRCETAWGTVSQQERSCFKLRGGKVSVLNPWLGGNYSFPMAPNPNGALLGTAGRENERTKLNLGFDMCTVEEGDGRRPELAAHEFMLPDIRACHATDCLRHARANASNYTLCAALAAQPGGLAGLTWPEHELNAPDVRAKVAPILTRDSVLLTQPPHGHCGAEFRARRGYCKHEQAPLGFAPALTRGFVRNASSFHGNASLAGRTRRDVLRLGRLPDLGVLGTWAGHSVFGLGGELQYRLLARDEDQTGAHRVLLRIESYTRLLRVANVALAPEGGGSALTDNWLARAHAGVARDAALIAGSSLYRDAPTQSAEFGHWACPLVRAAVFGGDAGVHELHPRLRLLTPDPARMRAVYAESKLGGAHPFVKTTELHDGKNTTVRAYARFALAHLFPLEQLRAANASTAAGILQHAHDFLHAIERGTMQLAAIQGPGVRPFADWPELPKRLRSGETHRPEDWGGTLDLGARLQDESYAAWWLPNGTLAPPAADAPDTLARGGDCHRAAVPVLTLAKLTHLLSFDDCRRAHSETPGMLELECSQAGGNGTERVALQLHPLNVARSELQNKRFARPRRADDARTALGATRLYAARGRSTFEEREHELSVSRAVRVSPLYALRRWLHATPLNATFQRQTVQELWQASLQAREQAWQYSAVAPATGGGLRAVGCVDPAGGAGAYNASAGATGGAGRWEACSAALASSRAAACTNGTNTMRDLELCEIDAFFDICAHIQQWRRDVAYVNAAAGGGAARVHAELYVPSMFDPATSAFVHESVRDTYVAKGATCAGGVQRAYEMRSAEKCYGAELIALVDELKLVHDYGMRVLFVIMDYYRLQLRFLYILVTALVPEVSDSFTSAVSLFWDDLGAFIESMFALFPDFLDVIFELVAKSSGFGIFSGILTGLCELFGRLADFVNSIVGVINNIPGVNVRTLVFGQFCTLWTAANTRAEYGYSEQLLPSRCVSQRLDLTVPVDFFGTTYGSFSCHRSSFCTPDAATLSDEHAVLCGTCADSQFSCDLATKTCRCGRDLDRPATPCMRGQDCAPLDSVCEVREGLTAALGTMACASSRAVRTCYLADARAAAGRCAVLPQHSVGLLPACAPEEVGQQASEAQVLGGEFCVATIQTEVGDAFEFDDTFTAPCYLLAQQSTVTQCVSMREPAGRALWLVLANSAPQGTTRRLLGAADGAAAGDPLLALVFASRARLLVHAGTGAGAAVSCLPVLAGCDARDPLATATCTACARVLWFWNMTLAPGSGGDLAMLAPHGVVLRLLREPALRREVHQRAPAALAELARHWLNDTLAWRALSGLWPRHRTTREAAPGHAAAEDLLARPRKAPAPAQGAGSHPTGAKAAHTRTLRRRLLQSEDGATQLGQQEAQRVQDSVDSWRDASATLGDLANRTQRAESDTVPARSTEDLSAGNPPECMKSGFAIVDNIQQRFTRVFKLRGFSPRQQCRARTATAAELAEDGFCPLVSLPFEVVLENFAILMRYYSYMAGTGCISNATTSCLPPAQHAYTSVEMALPRFNRINISENGYQIKGEVPNDGTVRLVLEITERFVSWTQVAFEHPARYFIGFMSLKAFTNDVEWERQRSANEWSLGRLTRDALTCDYEEITNCARLRSPLHIVLGSTLLLVVLLHFVVPLHPVLSFFMWTLAFTIGIPFFAYGFSPLCLPRVPNCMPEGLYNLTLVFVPEKIQIPAGLVRPTCTRELVPASSDPHTPACLLPCENETRIGSPGSILLALEPMLRENNTYISQHLINLSARMPLLGVNASAAHNLSQHFARVFSNGTHGEQQAVGLCMALHGYKVLAWYVLFVLMLPVVLVLLQYLLLAALSLFATLLMLVNNTTDLAFMPDF